MAELYPVREEQYHYSDSYGRVNRFKTQGLQLKVVLKRTAALADVV